MTDQHFDKLELTSYACGDSPKHKRDLIAAHCEHCTVCSAFVATLASERESFLAAYPDVPEISEHPTKIKARILTFPKHRILSVAATLILFVCIGFIYTSKYRREESRIKGTTSLTAYVKNASGGIEKRPSATYFSNEKIQFVYTCGERNRFMLYSIDTTGTISQYYPNPALSDTSDILERGADIPLPNSIVFDEYTGRELFVAVFTDEARFSKDIRKAIAETYAASSSIDSFRLRGIENATILLFPCTVVPEANQ